MTTTSASTLELPTDAELVARARELKPLLAGNAAQGETDRRVVEESIQALTDAGLFKISVPKRYGGYETSMRTMLDVSAEVAEADGGTSWVVTLINVCNWMVGLMPEKAQDEVFGADPDAKVSGVLAPTAETRKVDGGWRVIGQVVLQLRFVARHVGGHGYPDHRRRRKCGRSGLRPDPALRHGT